MKSILIPLAVFWLIFLTCMTKVAMRRLGLQGSFIAQAVMCLVWIFLMIVPWYWIQDWALAPD